MDKDDLGDVLSIPQLLLMTVWAIVLLPFALLIAWIKGEDLIPLDRVSCANCGYRMVEIETACPRCRANQQRMK